MPNCPAVAMTSEISEVSLGISKLMSLTACSSCLYSSSVASTVLRTPAKASSNSMDALSANPPSAMTGVVMYPVSALPTLCMVLPVFPRFADHASIFAAKASRCGLMLVICFSRFLTSARASDSRVCQFAALSDAFCIVLCWAVNFDSRSLTAFPESL